MRRVLRWLFGGLIGLILLASIGLAGGYLWLRQSLPVVDGTLEVGGLGAPVTIVRDRYAVPHIEAASFEDRSGDHRAVSAGAMNVATPKSMKHRPITGMMRTE